MTDSTTPAVDLVALRLDKGLSIRAAAKKMKVHKETLAGAESGESKPQPRTAFKIASFYGLRVTEVWPTPEREEIAA